MERLAGEEAKSRIVPPTAMAETRPMAACPLGTQPHRRPDQSGKENVGESVMLGATPDTRRLKAPTATHTATASTHRRGWERRSRPLQTKRSGATGCPWHRPATRSARLCQT